MMEEQHQELLRKNEANEKMIFEGCVYREKLKRAFDCNQEIKECQKTLNQRDYLDLLFELNYVQNARLLSVRESLERKVQKLEQQSRLVGKQEEEKRELEREIEELERKLEALRKKRKMQKWERDNQLGFPIAKDDKIKRFFEESSRGLIFSKKG